MRLHAFILHLSRATARRENAHRLLQDCGVPGEIWPAVDGAALSAEEAAEERARDLFAPRYPFVLKTGELGCSLSHKRIWTEMQDRDLDAALIIEDDATLDRPSFDTALALSTDHLPTLGYIQLQTRPHRGPARHVETRGDCTLVIPQVPGLRTTAQLLTRGAAGRLLAAAPGFDRPVDTLVQSHWHTGLRPGAVFPSGVRDIAGELDGSTIQGDTRPVWQKLGRECARLRYRAAVKRFARASRAPHPAGMPRGHA
ncbi:glycosyltransferase family 25 protein [Roseovarius salinarum]|uniref:glycosyltransferase family 25 protein n=1 Tax=Roseovarius salinarum TaxID=1981892 RepID=UPI000C34004D|nr:glycosyltransferase family 25 protein [Roseovarius salinarum]